MKLVDAFFMLALVL